VALDADRRRHGWRGQQHGAGGTPEQVAESLLDYYDIGVTTLLIRGFDPFHDAVDYGRELIPLVRAEVARRDREAAVRGGRFLAVVGSVSPPGRLHAAIAMAVEIAAERTGVTAALLDLADHCISFADGRPLEKLTDDTAAVGARVTAADVVMLASPVYRGTFTGALNLAVHRAALEGRAAPREIRRQ
jgi:hypothetical protein